MDTDRQGENFAKMSKPCSEKRPFDILTLFKDACEKDNKPVLLIELYFFQFINNIFFGKIFYYWALLETRGVCNE